MQMSPADFDKDVREKQRLEALKNIKGVFGVPLKTGTLKKKNKRQQTNN